VKAAVAPDQTESGIIARVGNQFFQLNLPRQLSATAFASHTLAMNSATAVQRAPETPTEDPPTKRSRWIIPAIMLIAPLLAGVAWHYASDDPLWRVFRASLNLCSLQQAELSPVSPDGRYRVHVVQANCAARFPETMLFVTDAGEPFFLDGLDPNRAVLEVAGLRSLDAVTWSSSAESADGKMALHLWLVHGSLPTQLHRIEDHWRDVPIRLGQSKPAPGVEKLDY
jgi:hypothetical protein